MLVDIVRFIFPLLLERYRSLAPPEQITIFGRILQTCRSYRSKTLALNSPKLTHAETRRLHLAFPKRNINHR